VIAGILAAVLSAMGLLFSILILQDSTGIGVLVLLGVPWEGALVLAFGAGFFAGFLSKRLSSGALAGVLSGIPSGVLTALMSGAVMVFVVNVDPRGNLYPAIATLVVIGTTTGVGALGGWAGRLVARAGA
jgi:hypothetical protein